MNFVFCCVEPSVQYFDLLLLSCNTNFCPRLCWDCACCAQLWYRATNLYRLEMIVPVCWVWNTHNERTTHVSNVYVCHSHVSWWGGCEADLHVLYPKLVMRCMCIIWIILYLSLAQAFETGWLMLFSWRPLIYLQSFSKASSEGKTATLEWVLGRQLGRKLFFCWLVRRSRLAFW